MIMLSEKYQNILGGMVMAVDLVLIGVLAVPAGVLLGAIALLWGGADRLIKAIER
ncbi:MAG: hypothetical protein ACI4PL_01685 [Faecousia sp.]